LPALLPSPVDIAPSSTFDWFSNSASIISRGAQNSTTCAPPPSWPEIVSTFLWPRRYFAEYLRPFPHSIIAW
jgi:hypothetical protein